MSDHLSYNPATTDPNYQPGIPPQWNPPTTPPAKKRWFTQPPVLIAAAAVLAFAAGSGSASAATVEVVKEVPGPERTVTKEVTVPTTPASCLEYITLSEQAFTYASEVMGYMNDALKAAASFNTGAVSEASANIKAVNPKLAALSPKVNAAKSACRAE